MIKKVSQYALIIPLLLFVCFLTAHFLHSRESTPSLSDIKSMSAENNADKEASAIVDGKININYADAETLTLLNGIGSALAQKIVDYREEKGPFRSVKELLNIKGIGQGTFDGIRDYITVGG